MTVKAPVAWAVNRGSGASVLILDGGYDRGHEDLPVVNAATNCSGTYGGCDDGGTFYHGTQMSAIAIGRDNTVGVVGVAPDVSTANYYSYGACDNSGQCPWTDIQLGLQWAEDHMYGPQSVINMSLGTCANNPATGTQIAAAWADGFVLVASAGNLYSGSPCGAGALVYPAAFTNVLGVSGVIQSLALANNYTCTPPTSSGQGGSNYGPHVDLTAPFEALSAKAAPSGYEINCGTSPAAAHVTGVAALVRSANPGWSNLQVVNRLISTAKDLGASGRDDSFGYGLVDAASALGIVAPTMTAAVVAQKPFLTWPAIPGAASYNIYRRVNYSQAQYVLWATVTGLSYTGIGTKVSSFNGYNTLPPSPTVSVSYYVTAVTSTGYETGSSSFGTFIPIGIPPQ